MDEPRRPTNLTADQILDPAMTLAPPALAALRTFKRSKPWRGTLEKRFPKFQELNEALCAAYETEPFRLKAQALNGGCSGSSYFEPETRVIMMRGKLWVVTYLHLFARARFENDVMKAVKWSVNVFRRIFPLSFSRCHFDGYMLRRNS